MQLRQAYMRGLGHSSRPASNNCVRAPTRGLSSGVRANAIQIAGKAVIARSSQSAATYCIHYLSLTGVWVPGGVSCTEHAAYISEVAVVPCPKRLPALLKVTPAGAAVEHAAR
jgi:hypothetical protein